ncbi:hypothetical protein [Streptomyces sp. 7G]|uniref:hypothetical protein n=1 Tax=Streptomyces sp. 7G TaxID=2877241 RepID=UPI0035AC27C2
MARNHVAGKEGTEFRQEEGDRLLHPDAERHQLAGRGHRDSLAHAGEPAQPGLDLGQFHPHAADTHLLVVAADVGQLPPSSGLDQVSGPVPALSLVLHETADVVGRVEIAAEHLVSCHTQLSCALGVVLCAEEQMPEVRVQGSDGDDAVDGPLG